ncbi:cupin domain-containing protein [Aliidiomarina soli]|uniref:Cupin domain-containing protein n=1 Tax=Aliidiomarina soli TaxID=1928574 RepID=A0A432WM51_9GAMM|nr:cupin domain-containing protein [Aliidiomarina soli]RUO34863.1 cupin domain-containing protein [Aliidiomarina soli]
MIFNTEDFEKELPLPANQKWEEGVWDIEAYKRGSMSLIYFAPEGHDYQTPHDQDELYFVIEGAGQIEIEGVIHPFKRGSSIFVAAGQQHQFIGELSGMKMWVVFWGPKGGESKA